MLYETAARASEILALTIEDLELDARRRARVAPSARRRSTCVLGLGHRAPAAPTPSEAASAVPVFLSERRPGPRTPAAGKDLCTHTGRARLGYNRARVLLDRYTSPGKGKPG